MACWSASAMALSSSPKCSSCRSEKWVQQLVPSTLFLLGMGTVTVRIPILTGCPNVSAALRPPGILGTNHPVAVRVQLAEKLRRAEELAGRDDAIAIAVHCLVPA